MTFIVVLLIVLQSSTAGQPGGSQSTDIPESIITVFQTAGLDRHYEISSHLKPAYLKGDFDGDRKPDIAILVKEKRDRRFAPFDELRTGGMTSSR